MEYITSKNNAKVKHACSLKENKYKKMYNEFLCEGKKSLELALESKLVKQIFTLKPLSFVSDDIEQYIVNEEIIGKMSFETNPEGIVFISEIPTFKNEKSHKKVLYLDHINDPGNMGTLIRTALAFEYDMVAISPDSVSPFNEKCIASSKGAIFKMPIINGELSDIKLDRKIIVSSLSDNSVCFDSIETPEQFILVLGNEAHGVSQDAIKLADHVVKIPISGIDSINVAVAGGILMQHYR